MNINITEEEFQLLLSALNRTNARERETAINLGVPPVRSYEWLYDKLVTQYDQQKHP